MLQLKKSKEQLGIENAELVKIITRILNEEKDFRKARNL